MSPKNYKIQKGKREAGLGNLLLKAISPIGYAVVKGLSRSMENKKRQKQYPPSLFPKPSTSIPELSGQQIGRDAGGLGIKKTIKQKPIERGNKAIAKKQQPPINYNLKKHKAKEYPYDITAGQWLDSQKLKTRKEVTPKTRKELRKQRKGKPAMLRNKRKNYC
tara:strand:+ start:1007 stop:1495 length:489 start_codon:yes stop_codon:yes gene_type:complete